MSRDSDPTAVLGSIVRLYSIFHLDEAEALDIWTFIFFLMANDVHIFHRMYCISAA